MNILELHSFELWDGPALHILDLIKGLIDLQQDVILACNSWTEMKRAEKLCPVINLGSPRISFRHVPALAKVIREHGVDIIHTHGGRTAWIALAASVLAGRGRVVNTWHGLRKIHDDVLHRWFYKNVTFIAVSEMLKGRMQNESMGLIKTVTAIRNGVDVHKFRSSPNTIRTQFLLPEDAFLIGFFGRIHPDKGVKYLAEAVTHLNGVYLLLVGWESDKDYAQEIRNISGKNVIFCGPTNDVVPFMSATDAMVLPSIFRDPCPLVVFEAMSVGKPVIATNNGGQAEVISDGVNGFLVDPHSSDQIAAKIKLLMEDKKLYASVSENGKRTVLEKFTFDVMAQNTLELFHSLYR